MKHPNWRGVSESVKAVITIVAEAQLDDPAAFERAMQQVRDLPEYDDFRERLFRDRVKELVYAVRHVANVKAKRAAGAYNTPRKVSRGNSPAVIAAYRSLLDSQDQRDKVPPAAQAPEPQPPNQRLGRSGSAASRRDNEKSHDLRTGPEISWRLIVPDLAVHERTGEKFR